MKRVTINGITVYTISCSHLLIWVLLLFFLCTTFALKPAKYPVFQKKPFIAVWNAPEEPCARRYNIRINLKMFHMIGSPLAKARGQDVTIFYANRLGYYPWYTEEEVPINGGLPQNSSLKAHLQKAVKDINYYIPSEDFTGLAVIDWEYWRPQWVRNWDKKDIYKRKSQELISQKLRNVSSYDIENVAKLKFEKSAVAFMKMTIQLGIRSRPKGLWGYYLYPDCHNYNFHDKDYTGSCPAQEVKRNNELFWLWNCSTALYPSIATKKALKNSIKLLHFSQFRVNESIRIAAMTSHDSALPVFVYTRLGYREEPLSFLSRQDLVNTIGESAALGAAGFVIWGDMNLTSSKDNCTKVKHYITSELGLYVTNVTKAAEVCSKYLCHNNGRCVRKNWQALDYLHLNPESYTIHALAEEEFTVTGEASRADVDHMAEKFSCHCYQGYEGADCKNVDGSDKQADSSTNLSSSELILILWLLLTGLYLSEI
uniref:Hyaluronidase n=2 Tax=Latimeria chalumnae TaxID=7897 RepID=H2ZVS5_LATCH